MEDRTNEYEVFISQDGTQYKWDRSQEAIVNLTKQELELLELKVRLMPDSEIQNRTSGNGITMGIPIALSKDRLIELTKKLFAIIQNDPTIVLSEHVIERIVLESPLESLRTQGVGIMKKMSSAVS